MDRAAISRALTHAWSTKRKRLPLGTKRTNSYGYIVIKVYPGRGQWKLEHIIVMESLLGRKLSKDECVHHIDGNKKNNLPNNLHLCPSRAAHQKIHHSQDTLFRSLFQAGLISFREGRYETLLSL